MPMPRCRRRGAPAGGRCLLRIEDIDSDPLPPRIHRGDPRGPRLARPRLGAAGPCPVRAYGRVSRRARQLAGRGPAVSLLLHPRGDRPRGRRRRPAPHGPDGPLYPGTCRRLSPADRAGRIARGDPFALRLDMAAALAEAPARPVLSRKPARAACAATPPQFGDAVLARKETPASYHLCVTHDDALQGVTLVTRGEDLSPRRICTGCCRR